MTPEEKKEAEAARPKYLSCPSCGATNSIDMVSPDESWCQVCGFKWAFNDPKPKILTQVHRFRQCFKF